MELSLASKVTTKGVPSISSEGSFEWGAKSERKLSHASQRRVLSLYEPVTAAGSASFLVFQSPSIRLRPFKLERGQKSCHSS